MTKYSQFVTTNKTLSFWQKLKAWLIAIDHALDYDPLDETIRRTRKDVARLEVRLTELEKRREMEVEINGSQGNNTTSRLIILHGR